MPGHVALTGPFPRSEALVRATREYDRGRLDPSALESAYAQDEDAVVALEARLGFDGITGGYLRWPDIFRPFAEHWEGFSVGPLTRWMATNTFFRQPILMGPAVRHARALSATWPRPVRENPETARVVLPGPYTFTRVTENRSGEPFEGLVHRLGRLLGDEVAELRGDGVARFTFLDPALVTEPPSGPAAEAVLAAYRAVAAGADGGHTLVWTYGADGGSAFPFLDRLGVSAVGVDLAETEVDRLPRLSGGKGLGLGVLDPTTSLLEDASELTRVIGLARERTGASAVWLGPGTAIELLSDELARKKLENLARVARSLPEGAP